MSERENEKLIEGHDADGIQEYDNPLPRWWLYIFYATILFSVGYWIYYHMGGPGKSQAQIYVEDMEQLNALKAKMQPKAKADEATLAKLLKDPAQVAAGKQIFGVRCMPCHQKDGGGLVGPNLTDDYWIHGKGTLEGIFKVVRDGVPAKGMIPWGTQLKPQELMQVSVYVASLSGTTPAKPKAPQGEKVKPSWK